MVFEDAGVIGRGFRRCRRIDLSADILDLFGDLSGCAPRRALEGHMFEKVGNTVFGIRFVAGA